jgi:hypothetical protein
VIDTVKQGQRYEADHRYWLDRGFMRDKREPRKLILNIANSPCLTVTFRRDQRVGIVSHLWAEYSIPKWIHGHNAILPVSREEALDAVTEACEWTSKIIGRNFEDAEIRRIDYARDYILSERIGGEVIHDLHARKIPSMRRRSFEGSLYWERPRRPKSRWTNQLCVYEKEPQTSEQEHPTSQILQQAVEAAADTIRLEVRTRGKGIDRLDRLAGGRTARHLIDEQLSNAIITECVRSLDFERILAARRIDFFELAESANLCTKERGITRFINLIRLHGPEFYKNPDFHWPKRTFYHYRAISIKAGFWDALVESSAVQIA